MFNKMNKPKKERIITRIIMALAIILTPIWVTNELAMHQHLALSSWYVISWFGMGALMELIWVIIFIATFEMSKEFKELIRAGWLVILSGLNYVIRSKKLYDYIERG